MQSVAVEWCDVANETWNDAGLGVRAVWQQKPWSCAHIILKTIAYVIMLACRP